MPPDPLGVRPSGTREHGARPQTEPLHPVLPNAIVNPASEYKSISLQCQDPTSFPRRFSLALEVGRPTSKAMEKHPGDEVGKDQAYTE